MVHVPEAHRITTGRYTGSSPALGNNGAFRLPPIRGGRQLFIIASDGAGWEHVSVHVLDGKKMHTPTWSEMCHVKDLFWDREDLVIQYHPPESQYVNNHPHTLHLWRPTEQEIPAPPSYLVGIKQTHAENMGGGRRLKLLTGTQLSFFDKENE
jgi:hypothetical protein